jgi:hypothetical protein
MTLVITHIETNADEGVLVKVMTPQEIVDVLVQLDEGDLDDIYLKIRDWFDTQIDAEYAYRPQYKKSEHKKD